MACTARNDSMVLEREPLQLNQETPAETKPNHDDAEQVELSLLIENQAPKSNGKNVSSYAIDPAYQNTTENPYRETTVTVPHLVKKVPEDDLTPPPWKTFNQILIMSYVSVFFCLCIGVFANREAWKAKMYNGKGLYGLAQKRAKRAVIISYIAVGGGFIMILLIILAVTGAL
ncbi:uncharacterized protein LOC133185316 [Saccostrea echinata]|uniref:uncharacterized protein LOC133185316 n=1 Tax=Saccostrea echinata TaxID=191078 RepID=UPI002A80D515|nr:uncharacterized protein LOC133185316 [Saccostrea echinata]